MFEDSPKSAVELYSSLFRLPRQKTQLELMRGFTLRLTKGEILVSRLHYTADEERDPDVHPQWKTAERKTYTSQAAWDREQEIVDEAGGGELVFADVLITHWKKIVIEDPRWRPDPEWKVDGGFDHGKTNPTALERSYTDFDGNIIYCGEYYQPGKLIWEHAKMIKRMADYERIDEIQGDPSVFWTAQQQSGGSDRAGHSDEKIKSLGELYQECGVTKLVPYAGDRSDNSFAERLLAHWGDLYNREPSVRIVCRNYHDGFQPGMHNWDSPNLLWELMTARRKQLTAQQLLTRNISEGIVDKDNHARDAMKYHLMTKPEPTRKSLERRVAERVAEVQKKADPTMAVIQYKKILAEERENEEGNPQYYGGGARRRFEQMRRRRGR